MKKKICISVVSHCGECGHYSLKSGIQTCTLANKIINFASMCTSDESLIPEWCKLEDYEP